jgi:hypothetical protein
MYIFATKLSRVTFLTCFLPFIDMVKGYSGSYVKTYMMASSPTFAVGEYWDSTVSKVKKTGGGGDGGAAGCCRYICVIHCIEMRCSCFCLQIYLLRGVNMCSGYWLDRQCWRL